MRFSTAADEIVAAAGVFPICWAMQSPWLAWADRKPQKDKTDVTASNVGHHLSLFCLFPHFLTLEEATAVTRTVRCCLSMWRVMAPRQKGEEEEEENFFFFLYFTQVRSARRTIDDQLEDRDV